MVVKLFRFSHLASTLNFFQVYNIIYLYPLVGVIEVLQDLDEASKRKVDILEHFLVRLCSTNCISLLKNYHKL